MLTGILSRRFEPSPSHVCYHCYIIFSASGPTLGANFVVGSVRRIQKLAQKSFPNDSAQNMLPQSFTPPINPKSCIEVITMGSRGLSPIKTTVRKHAVNTTDRCCQQQDPMPL